MLPQPRRALALCFAAVFAPAFLLVRAADKPTAAQAPSTLAADLIGVWVHVGKPGNIGPAPSSGGRLKFRMGRHWLVTHADSRTGAVIEHFGGTYTVAGNVYTEMCEYSTDPDDKDLAKAFRFTVKVDGDTMTQIGVGNPYNEVWKRVR